MNPRQIRAMAVVFGLSFVGVLFVAIGHFSKKPLVYASGIVTLDEKLATQALGIRTVFISVFDANQEGPPFGAARFELREDAKGEFLHFSLTPTNLMVMNPSLQIPKKLRLKARLDTVGKAGQDKPGDLIGFAEVKATEPHTVIFINHLVKER